VDAQHRQAPARMTRLNGPSAQMVAVVLARQALTPM
jgi:hypothetical protein